MKNSLHTFFLSFRMGPAASIIYEAGNAVDDFFFISPTLGFAGSSWSNKTPVIQEALPDVNEVIKGISTYNPFLINKMRLFIPDGVDSLVTFPKLSLEYITLYRGDGSGGYVSYPLPLASAYNRVNEQDRYFDFYPNFYFDQWSAIAIKTPDVANNWVDTTSVPLGIIEFTVEKMAERRKFYVS